MSNIISILSSHFIVLVAPFPVYVISADLQRGQFSKHNQLDGKRRPEQILLSQSVNHMVLLTRIGCGSSCHFPCGPVRLIYGTWYIDSQPPLAQSITQVSSSVPMTGHTSPKSVSKLIFYCMWICLTDAETGSREM